MKTLSALSAVFFFSIALAPACYAKDPAIDDTLGDFGATLLENTNALVNYNKDLVKVAQNTPGQEKIYILSLVDKLGDILILSFYEGRYLELIDKIRPGYKHIFYQSAQEGLERRAIPRIEANLSTLQVGVHKVQDRVALHVLSEAENIVSNSLKIMRRCVRLLHDAAGTP